MANGKVHFNTFGGNPIACAVGRAVLRVMDKEKTSENVEKIAPYMTKRLLNMKDKYEIVGDVRGKGFM